MKKIELYEVIEDLLWYRILWGCVIIGGCLTGVVIAMLVILFCE